MASKSALETMLRKDVLETITKALTEKYDTDVLVIGASEIAIPLVDSEANEKFAKIVVSIPRGTRNGNGGYDDYDGYAAAQDYALDLQEKTAKKEASAAKKEAEEKERQRKRAAKAVIKDLNKKGLKQMIHENEDEDDPNQYLDREVRV